MAYIGIDANGNRMKVAMGTFTTSADARVTIGFKAKKIMVYTNPNTNTFFTSALYDETDSISDGIALASLSNTVKKAMISSVDSSGFNYIPPNNGSYYSKTAYYIAIG